MWTEEITCLLIAFGIAAASGLGIVPLMKRLKFGQTERYNGVETHLAKNGTPTMGGWIFLIPMVLVTGGYALSRLIWSDEGFAMTGENVDLLVLPAVAILFGVVGFVDDLLKIKKKNKDGLRWYQKLLALLVVSGGFAAYMQFFSNKSAVIDFMFLGNDYRISMGWLYIPFVVFMLLAETNAVNLTDGLDGLCAGCSSILFIFFALVSVYLIPNRSVSVFSAISVGSLAGYMIYNYHPAKIFMGDTGSLALGGVLGAAAIMMNHPFLLFFAGLLFVFEALSVLLQIGFFKITHGKRLFKMAPLHHHFEKCGWKELTVTYVFWAFVALCCAVTFILARGFK